MTICPQIMKISPEIKVKVSLEFFFLFGNSYSFETPGVSIYGSLYDKVSAVMKLSFTCWHWQCVCRLTQHSYLWGKSRNVNKLVCYFVLHCKQAEPSYFNDHHVDWGSINIAFLWFHTGLCSAFCQLVIFRHASVSSTYPVWLILHTGSFLWKYGRNMGTFLAKIWALYRQKYEQNSSFCDFVVF